MNSLPAISPDTIATGVGIDLIEVDRIALALERQGDAFKQRIFTPAEIEYCDRHRQPAPHYAARFAAKEAIAKAMGTGIGEYFGWKTASVIHGSLGEPKVLLDKQGEDLLKTLLASEIRISLSHTRTLATAIAILTGPRP